MFVSFAEVEKKLSGRRIAIVGSGPGVLANPPGEVDSYDVVVRVNNYKLGDAQGFRCDVFYSFFGGSIRKTAEELKRDGVYLCLSKVPNSKPLESPWHEKNRKQNGIDFRYVYRSRESWWFCPVFVPDDSWFLRGFHLLDFHIPTTGFSAILDIARANPAELFITGFDFFSSGVHNVNEPWRKGDPADPIGHAPSLERAYMKNAHFQCPVKFDAYLERILHGDRNAV